MNLFTTRDYLKREKALIVRELMSNDQLKDNAIDDAIVLRTDQLEQIAQHILDQLMEDPEAEQDEEINAWSVDD